MSSPGLPFTSPPISNNDPANAAKWWYKFLSPLSDALDTVADGDTGWTNATLAGAWANFGSSFNNAGYRLLHGQVWLRGLVKSGAVGTIFTLPAGFRPMLNVSFPMIANNAAAGTCGEARIEVQAGGIVRLDYYALGGTNGFVSLEGINFFQAQ